MSKKNIFLMLSLFITIYVKANTIQGILLNNITNAQIPFASVYSNTRCGTTTDMEGKFVLHVKNIGVKDTLWISCVGYHRKAVSFNDLSFKTVNKIYLSPVTYSLDTSVVSTAGITPFQLLRNAFKNIKTNCNDSKHYYKANYYEQIKDYNHIEKWHTRTLNCAVIVEDPGYSKLHNSSFGIVENIYILGIDKGIDSLTKTSFSEPNLLTWTMENNYYHYTCNYLNSPKSYEYKIKNTYFDSTIQKNMLEISFTPIDSKNQFVYGEVYLTSSDHQIFKIHIQYKPKDRPENISSKKSGIYRFLSDVVVIYRPDTNNKMVLSYIKNEFGDENFYDGEEKSYLSSKRFMEFKVVEPVENGANLVKEIPKMDNNTRIYDQKVVTDTTFWLENNVILK